MAESARATLADLVSDVSEAMHDRIPNAEGGEARSRMYRTSADIQDA